MKEPAQVVEAYFGGHGSQYLAPEVEFVDMTQPGSVVRGREQVEATIGAWYGAFSESGARVRNVYTAGSDTVVVEFDFWGKGHRKPLGPLAPSGRDAELPICAIYRVTGEQIQRITLYYNLATLLNHLQSA